MADLSGPFSATQSKSFAAPPLRLRLALTIAASPACRCDVPSRSSLIVENSGQAHQPCAQSSSKQQRDCISDMIRAFCMMQEKQACNITRVPEAHRVMEAHVPSTPGLE